MLLLDGPDEPTTDSKRVYAKDDSRTSEGRPIYVEQSKSDLTPFDSEAPLNPFYNFTMDPIMAAEIKYCDGHWIFTHEYIRKSIDAFEEDYESDCHWLIRSPETDVYDVLEVEGKCKYGDFFAFTMFSMIQQKLKLLRSSKGKYGLAKSRTQRLALHVTNVKMTLIATSMENAFLMGHATVMPKMA